MIVAQDPEKNAKHTIAPENDRAAIICLSPSSDAGSANYYSGTLRFQYAKAQAAGFYPRLLEIEGLAPVNIAAGAGSLSTSTISATVRWSRE